MVVLLIVIEWKVTYNTLMGTLNLSLLVHSVTHLELFCLSVITAIFQVNLG